MFTPDVRFEGWSATDWARFLSLFRIAPPADPSEEAARGGLVIVYEGSRVRKALHTTAGRIDPDAIAWPDALEAVAREQGVRWVWALRTGALEELMERFGARIRRGDDALTQLLLFLGAFREMVDEGSIGSWPRRLRNVPIPTRAVVDRAIDAVVPPGRCLLLALHEEGALWTALVVRRATVTPARFDVVAGPAELRRAMGVVSGEFRRDYRHLAEAVEALFAPVSVGLHAEAATFRRLITTAAPGDWARAVALRDVVLSPIPSVLGLPLGLDATRGAVELAARAARQIDPTGIVQPIMRMIGKALPDLPPTGGASPNFNPLEVLKKLLER